MIINLILCVNLLGSGTYKFCSTLPYSVANWEDPMTRSGLIGVGRLLAAVLLLSLAFGGCSSDSGSSGNPDGDLEQDVPVIDGDEDKTDSEEETEPDTECVESIQIGLEDNTLDFGAVSTGSEQTQSFTITSDAARKIQSLSIFDDDETFEYSIVVDSCPDETQGACHNVTLNQNVSNTSPYTVTIAYTPRDADLTHDDAVLVIETDDPCVPTKRVKLISQCKGTPNLKLSVNDQLITADQTISFDDVLPEGTANPVTVKVENVGETSANAPVWITLTLDDQFTNNFEWSDCNPTELTTGFLLGSGENKICTLRFREKTDPGAYSGEIRVAWTSSCLEQDSSLKLDVSANVADCIVLVEPNPTLDFGEAYYNRDRVNDKFEIENRCPFPMILSGCEYEDSTNFTINCPAGREAIAAGADYTLNAVFHPTVVDVITDELTLTFEREDGSGQRFKTRDMVGRGTPCTYPGCCPPDSNFCQPGQIQCADARNREKCDTLCSWQPLETCPPGTYCTSSGCDPCIEGMETCNGAEHWLCSDSEWQTTQTCDDSNVCTLDFCTLSTDDADGCVYDDLPDGTPCDDSNPETSETRCQAGECLPWQTCESDGICCINGQPHNEGQNCTDDGNDCTADQCNDQGQCIHENKDSGATCGDQSDTICSAPDTCDGAGTCQPNHASDQTECRAAVGLCDVAEFCDGEGSCPEDGFKAETVECRPQAEGELCDVAELCPGDGPDCPHDGYKSDQVVCREADNENDCDIAESCTGSSAACPVDGFQEEGYACGDGDQCVSGSCEDCFNDGGCSDLAWGEREEACSVRVCDTESHSCEFDDETDGTVCDTDDQCLAGVCVDCTDVSGCSELTMDERDDECSSIACLEGNACGFDDEAKGTSCQSDGSGDDSDQCDGSGLCVDCWDNGGCSDLPWGDREFACSERVCIEGHICDFNDAGDGTVCGESNQDQCVLGTCLDCYDEGGCGDLAWDGRDDECTTAVCMESHLCDFSDEANGAPCQIGVESGDDSDQCLDGFCADCTDVSGCGDYSEDSNECTNLACHAEYYCIDENDDENSCDLGYNCTDDVCSGGACHISTYSGCLIEEACYEEDARKASAGDDSCKACDLASPTGWTVLEDGETCDDGDPTTFNDTCHESGSCTGSTLVAWWKFEEDSGTVALDSSGNGWDGNYINSSNVECGSENMLNCNGSESYVEVDGFTHSFDDFSISLWAKATSFDYIEGLLTIQTKGPGGQRGARAIQITTVGDGGTQGESTSATLRFFYNPCDGCEIHGDMAIGGTLELNQWYHIAGVRNGGTYSLYLNGENVSTFSEGYSETIAFNNHYIDIGQMNYYSGGWDTNYRPDSWWNGNIDEVKIYNYSMSEAEIQSLYEEGLCGTSCNSTCFDKECGVDGCGNSCGECNAEERCLDGQCEFIPFPVTPTNQHTCYDNASQIDCADIGGIPASCGDDPAIAFCGQDSQYHTNSRHFSCSDASGSAYEGCPLPAVEGDVAEDSLTGLIWQRVLPDTYAGCTGGSPSGSLCSFSEAGSYCEDLVYGGHDDWRLPNIYELRSLLDYGHGSPTISQRAFPNTPVDGKGFYTSTPTHTDIFPRDETWYVDFTDGRSGVVETSPTRDVRCVRGSDYFPVENAERYQKTGNVDNVILDTETGLQWIQQTHVPAQEMSWQHALSYCEELVKDEYTDWRLPTILELSSLVNPAIIHPSSSFPWPNYEVGKADFWSATSNPIDPYLAHHLAFNIGYINYGQTKTDTATAWCVRGGILPCESFCDGKECGDDGCGNSCGDCNDGEYCPEAGLCEPTNLEWVYSQPADIEFTKSEITVNQYKACVQAGGCAEELVCGDCTTCNWSFLDRGDHPVNCISGNSMNDFCEWAGGRLPTDDEWYAEASNNGSRSYAWGNEFPTCDYCIMQSDYGDETTDGCSLQHTWPVCSKGQGDSVSGLCDMIGNIRERTLDESNLASSLRGAHWQERDVALLRADHANSTGEENGSSVDGFRCVREGSVIDGDTDIPVDGDDDWPTDGDLVDGDVVVDGDEEIADGDFIDGDTVVDGDLEIIDGDEEDEYDSVADCLIEGQYYYFSGDINPNNPCQECKPDLDAYGWSSNGWCWFDPETRLIWEDPPVSNLSDWTTSENYCSDMVIGELLSWRLPTISELRSISFGSTISDINGTCLVTDDCASESCYSAETCWDDDPEPGPTDGCYWKESLSGNCGSYASQTIRTDQPDWKWYLNYLKGFGSAPESTESYARCVAECFPSCDGKECGPDGCGGWCDPGCNTGETCNEQTGLCEQAEDIIEYTLYDNVKVVPASTTVIKHSPNPCEQIELNFSDETLVLETGDVLVYGDVDEGFICQIETIDEPTKVRGPTRIIIDGVLGYLDLVFRDLYVVKEIPNVQYNYSDNTRRFIDFEFENASGQFSIESALASVDGRGRLIIQRANSVTELINLQYFGSASANATFGLDVSTSVVSPEYKRNLINSRILWFMVGPVPFSINFGADFSAKAEVSAGAAVNFAAQRVYDDIRASIWRNGDGNWDSSFSGNSLPPTDPSLDEPSYVDMGVSVSLSPYIQLAVLGYLGPAIKAKPEIKGGYHITVPPYAYLDYCKKALLTGRAEFFREFGEYEFPISFGNCTNIWKRYCWSGECCDTDSGNLLPYGEDCGDTQTRYSCLGGTSCGADVYQQQRWEQCDGSSALCDGNWSDWIGDTVADYCSNTEVCQEGLSSCQYASSCDCECTSGDCCSDGCNYDSSGSICQTDAQYEYGCPWGTACGADVGIHYRDRYCSGNSESCDGGYGSWKSWQTEDICSSTESCSSGDPTCNGGCVTCECSSGDCCTDGCNFDSSGTVCDYSYDDEYQCTGSNCGDDGQRRYKYRYCSGALLHAAVLLNGRAGKPSVTATATNCVLPVQATLVAITVQAALRRKKPVTELTMMVMVESTMPVRTVWDACMRSGNTTDPMSGTISGFKEKPQLGLFPLHLHRIYICHGIQLTQYFLFTGIHMA